MNKPMAKLSSHRPGTNSQNAMDKLKSLDKWTETPTVEASASIGAEKPKSQAEDTKPVEKPAVQPKKAEEKGAVYPWDDANERVVVNFMLRPNEILHAKLSWLGATTYGESMQSIAITAIEAHIKKLLAERGIK